MANLSTIADDIHLRLMRLVEQRIRRGETHEIGFWTYYEHFCPLWIDEALDDPAVQWIFVPPLPNIEGAVSDGEAFVANLRNRVKEEVRGAMSNLCHAIFTEYLKVKLTSLGAPPKREEGWIGAQIEFDRQDRIRRGR